MNPFEKLSKETIEELLIAIPKNFSKYTIGNVVKEDYSKHYKLYQELLRYVGVNARKIEYDHQLTANMDFGGYVIYLLNHELKKR
jgi:hypothetical protein